MKVSKIFGCVLSLHLCVIAVLLMQPGCQTAQPPTQTHRQEQTIRSNVQGASRTSEGLIPASRVDFGQGLDSAFNSGLDSEAEGLEPVEALEPIEPSTSGQTVDVAGPGFETHTVKKGDNLWSISKRYNVPLDEIYAANDLNKNSVLRVGQRIQIPVEGGTATIDSVTPDMYQPSGYNQETTDYTVKRGDNLSKIAKQYGTTVRAIKAANGKSSDMIRVGETLTIPVEASSSSDGQSSSGDMPSAESSEASASGPTQTHTVKAGEYPAKIARQYGMTTSELLAINGISDPRKLRVGQELTVSGSGSAANVDSRIETATEAPATAQPERAAPVQAATGDEANAIRVLEAEPLLEGELDEDLSEDDVFDNAVEIPVIRLEE